MGQDLTREETVYTYYTWGNKIGALIFSSRGLIYHLLPASKTRIEQRIRKKFKQAKFRKEVGTQLKKQLCAFFEGEAVNFKVKLDWRRCTPFQRQIYVKLRNIPYGKTCYYQWLAKAVGAPGAARAVGLALKHNPFPIIVPCHRVVRKDGSLGGFLSIERQDSCGLEWKRRLLKIEVDFAKKIEASSSKG